MARRHVVVIAILDYGVGNLASVANALSYLGLPNTIISEPAQVANCDRLILPGVGAYGHAMRNLENAGLVDAIREHAAIRTRPLLGICLGMQLLLEESAEGGRPAGIGLLRGKVEPLTEIVGDLVVPHVGWNDMRLQGNSRLLESKYSNSAFYFVHSYYCVLSDAAQVTGTADYGREIHVMVEHENIFGCQFHPEKSQRRGLDILNSFASC
jgi:glutamine amidotransferase